MSAILPDGREVDGFASKYHFYPQVKTGLVLTYVNRNTFLTHTVLYVYDSMCSSWQQSIGLSKATMGTLILAIDKLIFDIYRSLISVLIARTFRSIPLSRLSTHLISYWTIPLQKCKLENSTKTICFVSKLVSKLSNRFIYY